MAKFFPSNAILKILKKNHVPCTQDKKNIGNNLEIFVGDESMKAHWYLNTNLPFYPNQDILPPLAWSLPWVYHVHSGFLLSFLHLAEG